MWRPFVGLGVTHEKSRILETGTPGLRSLLYSASVVWINVQKSNMKASDESTNEVTPRSQISDIKIGR